MSGVKYNFLNSPNITEFESSLNIAVDLINKGYDWLKNQSILNYYVTNCHKIQPHYVMPGWSGNGISLIIVLSSLSPELVSISSKLFFKLILSINYAFQSSSISFSLPENSSSSSDWSAE